MKSVNNVINQRTNALKTFSHIFVKSISSFDYFADIIKAPFGLSFKYFVALTFIATLVTTTKAAIPVFKETEPGVKQVLEGMVSLYPENLVLDINNGEMKSSSTEAVTIKNPSFGKSKETGNKEVLLIIDEKGTIEDLKSKNTLMVLNKKNLLIEEETKIRVYPLSKIPNVKIDKNLVQKTVNEMNPMIKALPYIIVTLLLGVTFIFYLVTRAFYLCAVAAVLWGFSLFVDESFKFGKLYQVAIHAMTIPLVLELLFEILPTGINISFVFPVLNIIIAMGGMLYATRKNIEE